ncbi:hypothetical protein N9391_01100 [Gammaproteobacteria bacterium]|nr:hypothetical protein [Gammaproteobacteria bacterium]
MTEETITISKSRYLSLLESERWLAAYGDAGVDNWDGRGWAQEAYEELGGDNYEGELKG